MHRSWVEVSLGQIAENYRCAQRVVGPAVKIAAVVKADAYRHGAVEVSRALMAEGVEWLAVSSVEEGVTLRDAGIRARILVMADFLPFERPALLEHDLTPVVHSLEDLHQLDAFAQRAGRSVPYHLKLDTGMTRLGTSAGAEAVLEAVTHARHAYLEGLMTHFASAGDYTKSQTDEQLALFESLLSALAAAGVRPAYVHAASTNAVAFGRRPAWFNMVRPGHALYGYVSAAKGEAPPCLLEVRPALSWKTRILSVKDVPQGVAIGYGGMFRAPRAMRIAILAVGYADGFPHRLSNKGKVIAAGRLVPILGAVSMDLTTIDVTHCPSLQPGDPVTLLGREGNASLDAVEIARTAGTISYNVLCSISARVKRVYTPSPVPSAADDPGRR